MLAGELALRADGLDGPLRPGSWAYLPPDAGFSLRAGAGGRRGCCGSSAATSRGRGSPRPRRAPATATTSRSTPDPAVPGFRRRELLDPLDPRHDFNMSLLAFDPGVGLRQGRGPRRGARPLHDRGRRAPTTSPATQHEVRAHDFIYMAPYCPQSFVATGDEPAEYLLYKDVYRDGF